MEVPPHPFPVRRSGRERLVEAGWDVIDDLPLHKGLGAVSTGAVAARAGVTTGSFFHHFGGLAEFTDALVLSLLEEEIEQVDDAADLLGMLDDSDVVEIMTSAMADRWRRHCSEPERFVGMRHEMLAWANSHRPLAHPSTDLRTVGDILRQRVRSRQDAITPVWELVLDSVGRTVIEPFTTDRLSTALTAVFYGLGIRHAIEPDAVDDDLFADITGALLTALSKPVGSDRNLADVAATLRSSTLPSSSRTPQARSGARRRAETRARIVESADGLFDGGWEHVTASEIADRAAVSSQTVANVFGSPRAVAAATFATSVPAVLGATPTPERNPTGPGVPLRTDPATALSTSVAALAAEARARPEPAKALLAEIVATISRRGDLVGDGDIRAAVPLADAFVAPIESLCPAEHAPTWAQVLVNFTLLQAVTGAGDPDGIAAMALRLLPSAGESRGSIV